MTDDRLATAFQRIDAALSRIEASAANPPSAGSPDEGLAARHRELREEVGHSLAELDRLIDRLET